jgi:hypothetical protein
MKSFDDTDPTDSQSGLYGTKTSLEEKKPFPVRDFHAVSFVIDVV